VHLTVHLFAPHADRNQLYRNAYEMLSHQHGISEITLQIEEDQCIVHEHEHDTTHDHETQSHSH
ncbi:MAG TPA: cation transporter, partial [Acinetobacter ursingii]|nr:cation transporter [Acinetobacter ursingii]